MDAQNRRLVRVWLALMALTAAMGLASETGAGARLAPLAIVLVVTIAFVKARLVLAHYLDLRTAPAALSGFAGATALVLVLVAGLFIFLLPA
jgi:hypothetical protein